MKEQNHGAERRSVMVVIIFLLLLQFVSRYGAAPITDFTTDDWSFLQKAQSFSSLSEVWRYSLLDSTRPLHLGAILSVFYLFGDNPVAFAGFTALAMSILLGLSTILVYMLTGRPFFCLVWGTLFALWPAMTENFHYYNVIPLTQQCTYVLCAIFWIQYLRTSQSRWLTLSGLAYFGGLLSYELGWLLPIPLFILSMRNNVKAGRIGATVLFSLLTVYLIWRFTKGFGLTQDRLCGAEYFRPEFSLWIVRQSVYSVASWWIGQDFWRIVTQGGSAFIKLPVAVFYLWGFLNLLVAGIFVGMASSAKRIPPSPVPEFPKWILIVFGLLWWGASHAAHALGGTSGRHIVFPSIGLFLAAVVVFPHKEGGRVPTWAPLLFITLALGVNQGTTISWKEAGLFNRNLYHFLAAKKSEWGNRDYVLLDTTGLVSRLKGHIACEAPVTPAHWAYYGNAHLLRGFAPQAMIDMLGDKNSHRPRALLDREYGASVIEGGFMAWHERYDPTRPHTNALADVFIVDCLAVGGGEPAEGSRQP